VSIARQRLWPARAGAGSHCASENKSPAASPTRPPADLSGYRSSFDLVANRVHAVEHRAGRLVMAAGGVGFLKFIDGGWKGSWLPLHKDGATPVAYVSGTSAAFSFPVDADGTACWPQADPSCS